jgi:hypothetical protein
MNNSTSKRSPLLFFVLVYALSIPLWVLNVIYPMKLPVDNLPVTDIVATFFPNGSGIHPCVPGRETFRGKESVEKSLRL